MSVIQKENRLSVAILLNRSRPGDGKLASLVDQLTSSIEHVIVEPLPLITNSIRKFRGWVMILQDDSHVDCQRLLYKFGEFLKFASQSDILLPYKCGDTCNLGSTLSMGDFYRTKDIKSLRGMIFHRSLLERLDEYNVTHRSDALDMTIEIEDPLTLIRKKPFTDKEDVQGPLGKEYPSLQDIPDEATDYDTLQSDTAHNHNQTFHLSLSFGEQICALEGLVFYTVYPNAVQYDSTYARRYKDMIKLNECMVYPNNMGEYVKSLAYDNVYTIIVIMMAVMIGFYVIYHKFNSKRKHEDLIKKKRLKKIQQRI